MRYFKISNSGNIICKQQEAGQSLLGCSCLQTVPERLYFVIFIAFYWKLLETNDCRRLYVFSIQMIAEFWIPRGKLIKSCDSSKTVTTLSTTPWIMKALMAKCKSFSLFSTNVLHALRLSKPAWRYCCINFGATLRTFPTHSIELNTSSEIPSEKFNQGYVCLI